MAYDDPLAYMKALNSGSTNQAMKYLTNSMYQAFQPRYSQAAEGAYARGWDVGGTPYQNALAPVDKAMSSAISDVIPNMYFQTEQNKRSWEELALQRQLGLGQLSLGEDTLDFNRKAAARSRWEQLFGGGF